MVLRRSTEMSDDTSCSPEGRRKRNTVDRSHRSSDSIKRPCSDGLVVAVADGTSDDRTTEETPAASCEKPQNSSSSSSSNRKDDNVNHSDHDESNTNTNHHHFSFPTNSLDHCETPKVAYQHVEKFLEVVFGFGSGSGNSNSSKSSASASCSKYSKESICIWDPFYCNGTVKKLFLEMGFPSVKNDNVDFYQLIQQEQQGETKTTAAIPRHDVLVTNPPYSDNHIPRLLQFVVESQVPQRIPCCLLLPNWVARQADYVANFVEPLQRAQCELFYLSPLEPYAYTMPSWVRVSDRPSHVGSSGQTTPYLSSWYIVVPSNQSGNNNDTNKNNGRSSSGSFLEQMDAVSKQEKPYASWVVAKTVKGLKWKIKNQLQNKNNKQRKKGRK